MSNKYSTLIILDWDDTLFPTSWLVKNNLNINDINVRVKYKPYFDKLDKIIYNFIRKLSKYGKVIIVTNAMPVWVKMSSNVLPNTKRLLEHIRILSARKLYQYKYDMPKWKTYVFRDEISREIKNNKILNIISIGDAEYEYKALVNLYNFNRKKKKILKSIKLMKNPSDRILIDQLEILDNVAINFCKTDKHLDLVFKSAF